MAEKRATLWDFVKIIFIILIMLQIAPVLLESIRRQYSKILLPRPYVGVLPIKGLLYDSSQYDKHLTTLFKNNDVKAILLKIESNGSTSGTGQALFNEIQSLKKEYPKPIIVLVENICTSGGYYIASSADYIIAAGTATVGSIGTYLPSFALKDFIEQFKIHYDPIKSGTYKTINDPLSSRTQQETALLQELSDDIYNQFTQDIATMRKLSLSNINEWAEGKIFTGRQALKLGLIDELGSAQTAIRVIKEKALIEGEIEWIYPQTQSMFASFFGGQQDDDSTMFNYCATQLCTFLENRYLNVAAH
jgi:protease-4